MALWTRMAESPKAAGSDALDLTLPPRGPRVRPTGRRLLQAAFPLEASLVTEPLVPPLLEPRLPKPASRDPGRYVPYFELLHRLVVHLAVASWRHQPFGAK